VDGSEDGSPTDSDAFVAAGIRCAMLLEDPTAWINRRVETVELLSAEETRLFAFEWGAGVAAGPG
jgi:hypothetical protein